MCNFKLGLRKHVASDGSVCGNWLWKTETPGFSWQDVILIASLERKTSDERKRGAGPTGDDGLRCESGEMKRRGVGEKGVGGGMGQVTRRLRKREKNTTTHPTRSSSGSSLFLFFFFVAVVVSGRWN